MGERKNKIPRKMLARANLDKNLTDKTYICNGDKIKRTNIRIPLHASHKFHIKIIVCRWDLCMRNERWCHQMRAWMANKVPKPVKTSVKATYLFKLLDVLIVLCSFRSVVYHWKYYFIFVIFENEMNVHFAFDFSFILLVNCKKKNISNFSFAEKKIVQKITLNAWVHEKYRRF